MDSHHNADSEWWQHVVSDWNTVVAHNFEKSPEPLFDIPPRTVWSIAVRLSAQEVLNGGAAQLFWNSSGLLFPELLAGLELLGYSAAGDMLKQAASYFSFDKIRLTSSRRSNVRLLAKVGQEVGSQPTPDLGDLDDHLIQIFADWDKLACTAVRCFHPD